KERPQAGQRRIHELPFTTTNIDAPEYKGFTSKELSIAIAATFRNNRAMRISRFTMLALLLIAPMALRNSTTLAQTGSKTPTTDVVLHSADLDALVPPSVFFQGITATTQKRNSGGVRFAGGPLMFAMKVDTGGYSSAVQEKYQTYLITETALDIGGHKLPAGAYGVGFIANNKFLVMDLGGNDIFTVTSQHDDAMTRPTPLQVQADPTHGFRLYTGRDFVAFNRSPASTK
ncbi:MAG TPA: hypothetical protein VIX90_15690, partial [Edaphobacter sp.]